MKMDVKITIRMDVMIGATVRFQRKEIIVQILTQKEIR